MVLKKKKGHFQVTKTQVTNLKARKPEWLRATRELFNQVVEFYVLIYQTHPELADVSSKDIYQAVEPLTIPRKKRPDVPYPLPICCPQGFRRAAIKKALGIYKSWHTSYVKWQLKVKHKYEGDEFPPEWVKGCASIVIKPNRITLNWVYAKNVPSLGKISQQIEKNGGLRLCAVDLNLDGEIAVISILESDGKNVRELATRFIKGNSRHQHRRKCLLGRDAVKKSQTNAPETLEGMNARLWGKLKNREKYEGERVSRRIAAFAHKYGASVIVFEHLTNLKPSREKYSRRSNQKRAYWLKSKIYLRCQAKALHDYGILTVRVSPKNTSRVWAIDGTPVLRGNQISERGFVFTEKGMGSLILTQTGEIQNSDLNSARNIGIRYLSKYFDKPTLVTERFGSEAMNYCRSVVPSLSTVSGTTKDLATSRGSISEGYAFNA